MTVHRISRGFTRAGFAHLRSQLTGAAASMPANIVEGCGAATNKEFARFLDISIHQFEVERTSSEEGAAEEDPRAVATSNRCAGGGRTERRARATQSRVGLSAAITA